MASAGLLLLAGALAAPSFWSHHLVVLGLAGAGLWRVLAARDERQRLWVWTWTVAPLAATITLPFFIALFVGGFESGLYRDLREYGVPTAAAVNFFVTGIAVTTKTSR